MVPQVCTILGSVSMVLMILAVNGLITPHRISCHLVQPFKERLIFNLLQNLLYWFSEHGINHLSVGRSWLPNKVFLRSVIIVPVWPEIPPLLRDHLSLSFPLHLVFFYPSVLINSIHKLTHTGNRLTNQRFPQIMLGWEASLESTNGHIVIVSVYFVKHLPVSIWVNLQSLPLLHEHKQ